MYPYANHCNFLNESINDSSVSSDRFSYSSEPIKCPSPRVEKSDLLNPVSYEDELIHYNNSTWAMYYRIKKAREQKKSIESISTCSTSSREDVDNKTSTSEKTTLQRSLSTTRDLKSFCTDEDSIPSAVFLSEDSDEGIFDLDL